ncbi:MAG: hypothetical protein KDD33_12060 [Bdellovibrionales bacterium]|nr:hypothetical protein [Bdellovibrionales bacterium]
MRVFISIIVILSASFSYAEVSRTKQIVLDEFLVANGFQPLHKMHPVVLKMFPVHQIYASPDKESVVFFANAKKKQKSYYEITQLSKGTQVAYRKSHQYGVWFFHNTDKKILEGFQKILKSSTRSYASETTFGGAPPPPPFRDDGIDRTEQGPEPDTQRQGSQGFLGTFNQCFWEVANGALDNVTGTYESVKEGLYTLFTDPGKFWDSTVEAFQGIKNIIPVIRDGFMTAMEALSGLTLEHLRSVVCQVMGMLSIDIALALTGAGAAKLGLRMSLLVPKLVRIAKLLAAISKGHIAGGIEKIKDIVAKALNPNLPKGVLDWSEYFTNKADYKSAVGVFNCAI